MGQEENWDAYLWPSDDGPGARMLRNNYGLHNRAALTQREYDATSKREVQLVIGQAQLPQTRDPSSAPDSVSGCLRVGRGVPHRQHGKRVGARSSTTGTSTSGWLSHVSRSEQRTGAALITDSSLPPPVSR